MWNKNNTKLTVHKLGDLLIDFTTKNKSNDSIPVYSVTNDKGFIISTEYFSKEVFSKNLKTYKIVEKGDFAYNPSRINVGSIDFFQEDDIGLISPLYVTFKARDCLYKKYLKYYLKSSLGNAQIRNNTSGSVRDTLSFKNICNIQIPLPSPEAQKRIVKILDQADALRQKRRKAIKLLDEYLKSVFLEMFGDPVTNPKGFPVGIIGNLVFEVKYGTSKKAGSSGEFSYLRMKNITYSGELNLSSLKYINLNIDEQDKYLVKNGDLLFNRTNSKELVGKTTVYNLKKPMAIAGYLIRVRTNEHALSEYISGYLNSKHGKLTLENMCKNIVGMANINAKELQKIRIIIPPIDLQRKYKNIIQETYCLKQKMLTQTEELETQFQALMQMAFKGELVKETVKAETPVKSKNYIFGLLQGIGAIIEAFGKNKFQYGEMVTAKFAYLLQEIFKVPLEIPFAKESFGPYNIDIKKAVGAGIKRKYFARGDRDVLILSSKSDTLLGKNYPLLGQSRKAMTELMSNLENAKSHKIECLATVCKAIQDSENTDFHTIKKELKSWETPAQTRETKADKFSDEEIQESLIFVKKQGWEKALLVN